MVTEVWQAALDSPGAAGADWAELEVWVALR